MTTDQFLFKARQGRMIQWLKSGKIEYVFMNRKGTVLAKNILTGELHFIHTKGRTNWDCRVVKIGETVQLGQLL